MKPHRMHTCDQCGTTFCAKREDARFCSARCRKRHQLGKRPDTAQPAALKAFLERNGFAHEGALNVYPSVALVELNAALKGLQQRGLKTVLQPFTEFTFRAALRAAGIRPA